MQSKKNPVERRLDWLHDQWVQFTQEPRARLLRWVVESEEVRMVEAWLKKEGDERVGECPDLFLRFDEPFEQLEAYGGKLLEALRAQVKENCEPVEWGKSPPGQPGGESFWSACEALQRHHAQVCEVLAVVLVPRSIESAKAWQEWLCKAVEHLRSPQVRLVVLDDARGQLLEPVVRVGGERVKTVVARLDMPGAVEAVARAAGPQYTPGWRYRELMARLGSAAQRRDLPQTERLGGEAVRVASEQGWHGLAVAAHWVVGGALLAASTPRQAAARYQQAEVAAAKAEAQGEPQAAEVRLKTRLALGAAQVSGQEWAPAAVIYEESVPLAQKLKDTYLELECWRMGSLCRESLQEWDKAWEHGQRAWEVGKTLTPEALATSTLPYVAEALVRLGQARQGEAAVRQVESEAEALLGREWRNRLPRVAGRAA
jgi:hypothetical protein